VRVWGIAACVTLGFVGTSSANPLDSPGTVYIDGLPCNLPCQSYMAWSRQTLMANQAAARRATNASADKAAGEAPRKRISKRVVPASAGAPSQKKIDDLQAALTAIAEPPPLPRPRAENAPLKVETSKVPKERSPQEQVMAALAVAEQITNAEPPRAAGNDGADETKSASAGETKVAPPSNVGALVALLITRLDVKSASALEGSNIAIDAAQSGAEQEIRTALAAAGAAETQLSVSDASPLDRLISGDVLAALLKLVSPDAAEAFPDIKGFKVLRVPLSPR
jgi:hypothetical protein